MSPIFYFVSGFAALLFVLLRNLPSYSRFRGASNKLALLSGDEIADTSVLREFFPGSSLMEKAAHRVLANMADAHERGLLQHHDVDESIKRVRAAGASVSSAARALAGIVIISGLLVTLFNLRASVGHLQGVFENMKATAAQGPLPGSGSDAKDEPGEADALQSAMAGIARSAASAFGISAVFISFACGLLLGAALWSSRTASCIGRFEDSVQHVYFLIVPPQRDQAELLVNLSSAVENLHELSETFKQTNTTLMQIGGFGDRFEAAAREISDAVVKLPVGMRESVSDMSGKLARDIAAELEHYIEHIKHIEAIYGDQQTLLTGIVTAMSNMEDDWRRSSEALVELRALPEKLGQFKSAVDVYVAGTGSLNTSVTQLNNKVEALPVNDLAGAAREMRELTTNLAPLVSAVQDVSNRMKDLVAGIVKDSQQEAKESLLRTLAQIESRVNDSLSSGLQAMTGQQKEALGTLHEMATSVNLEVRRLGAGQNLLEVAAKLQALTEQIGRVPKLPKFLSKSSSGGPAQ